MDAAVIDDLKDFISQKLDNSERNLERSLDEKLEQKLEQKLNQTRDEIFEFVGDALETGINSHDKQLANHERRITRLERKA